MERPVPASGSASRHSKLIAIAARVIFFPSLAAATRIPFDPHLLNLIPQNIRQVKDFRHVLPVSEPATGIL